MENKLIIQEINRLNEEEKRVCTLDVLNQRIKEILIVQGRFISYIRVKLRQDVIKLTQQMKDIKEENKRQEERNRRS